jgi:D-glycero-D-manno-heptose 1,7-bisphosphate phosphatase
MEGRDAYYLVSRRKKRRKMKRRGLLLDRDGVINEDHGYISSFDRFDFKAGIFPFLRRAVDNGF